MHNFMHRMHSIFHPIDFDAEWRRVCAITKAQTDKAHPSAHPNTGDIMFIIMIRTVIVYAIIIAAVRIMGKRQVSEMQTSELVVTIIISQVASLPLENAERPLLQSVVPILMLAAIEIIASLIMLKCRRARGIICGHPIVIIRDGRMVEQELNRLRISREDVYSLLRQQNYSDEKGVRYGIIEPNGSLSVLTDQDLSGDGIASADLREELRDQENTAGTQRNGGKNK